MKVVVGLGNPGPKYAGTRHNAGFMVVQRLAERWSIPLRSTLCRSKVGQGLFSGHAVRLALPQTSMNASGEAVECLARRWRLDPSALLVVCDDVSLPLGMIRLRGQGSAGGHRGLGSVLDRLQTEGVSRLRVGIRGFEEPSGDLTDYVLGRLTAPEKKVLEEALLLSGEACETWVSRGLSAAMNRFNQKAENGVIGCRH
ncbi:MAG: aminoacyl-tRNA hydrolase [Candidatus Omnitrophica bacterium]|nr:aminoacyl-tRNA hydrolase [Candidatus Omnitrophota bacterium]